MRASSMLWVVIVAVAAARADPLNDSSKPRNASAGWLASLRRQLMRQNYDYLPPGSSEAEAEGAADEEPSAPDIVRRSHDESTRPSGQYSYVSLQYSPPQYATAAAVAGEAGEGEGEERGVSRKDLLYYVDDARLAAPAHNRLGAGRRAGDLPEAPAGPPQPAPGLTSGVEPPPPTVSYKLIQVPGGSRRSGRGGRGGRGGGGPRFVEERGAHGVAIVSVDGAPFPQFRLPAPRRQYAPADADSYEVD